MCVDGNTGDLIGHYQEPTFTPLAIGPVQQQERTTRRAAKEKIKEILAEGIEGEQTFQCKPWTCYTAQGRVAGWSYNLLGFAKVIYPDEWDADEGIRIARRKALSYMTKQIMLWLSLHEVCPQEVCPWDSLINRWQGGSIWDEPLARQAYLAAVFETEKAHGALMFDGWHEGGSQGC